MSAVIAVKSPTSGGLYKVQVPRAQSYRVDDAGYLHIEGHWGERFAVFKPAIWDHAVITPDRGPDGKFVKKGSR